MSQFKFKSTLIILFSLFTVSSAVFSQEKILVSGSLGEAEFHFDAFYKIVDCGGGKPQLFITAFNESGKDQNIAFDITIQDAVSGVTQEIKVPFFFIKSFDLFMPTCSDDKHINLKYDLDSRINYKEIKTTIKFSTN